MGFPNPVRHPERVIDRPGPCRMIRAGNGGIGMIRQLERLGRQNTRLLMVAILFAAAVVVGVQTPAFAASPDGYTHAGGVDPGVRRRTPVPMFAADRPGTIPGAYILGLRRPPAGRTPAP